MATLPAHSSTVKSVLNLQLSELIHRQEKEEKQTTSKTRPLAVKVGVFENKKGNAYVEFGETKVLAQVFGPRSCSQRSASEKAKLIVKQGGAVCVGSELKDALNAMIQLHKLPRSAIKVEVNVLSSDGPALPAAVMAASLALIHAGIEVFDVCVCTRVVFLPDGTVQVDPPGGDELPEGAVQITIGIMPNINQIVFCDIAGCTTVRDLDRLVDESIKVAHRLYPIVKESVSRSIKNRS